MTFTARIYGYPGNHFDDLPENVKCYLEEEFEFKRSDEEMPKCLEENSILIVENNDKIIFSHMDGGEPEDQTFGRDLDWITGIIEEAYQMGQEA